ncbi:hypothetical protein Tco_0659001 [Tanacetum coccineum]
MKLQWSKDPKSGDLSSVHAECLTDTWIGKDRWAFIDLSAGPFSWGPAVGGEGVHTELSLPNVEKTIGAVAELEERMGDLRSELESFGNDDSVESHKEKAAEALKRIESWNLFSDAPYEESHNYTVARDTFLAHMGATLWGSMRHIISPSIADGAFHHYDKISFQLFFIMQASQESNLILLRKCRQSGISSICLWISTLSWMDFPLYCYLLKNHCSVITCMFTVHTQSNGIENF